MIRTYFRLYDIHLFSILTAAVFSQISAFFEEHFAPILRSMWYLQFHFVCAKLFVSFIFSLCFVVLQLPDRNYNRFYFSSSAAVF